jgi:hypothetical protein
LGGLACWSGLELDGADDLGGSAMTPRICKKKKKTMTSRSPKNNAVKPSACSAALPTGVGNPLWLMGVDAPTAIKSFF